jgi:hypothetical protein
MSFKLIFSVRLNKKSIWSVFASFRLLFSVRLTPNCAFITGVSFKSTFSVLVNTKSDCCAELSSRLAFSLRDCKAAKNGTGVSAKSIFSATLCANPADIDSWLSTASIGSVMSFKKLLCCVELSSTLITSFISLKNNPA